MNVQTTPSVGRSNQTSSSSLVGSTSSENTSSITQLLSQQSSYEFSGYPKQSFMTFCKRGKRDPLEVIKAMPQQNYHGSMLINRIIHPQKLPELLDRWKSDTINTLEKLPYTLDNVGTVNFIKHLLGTISRNMMYS